MRTKKKEIQADRHSDSFLRLGGHPILDFINTKVVHSNSTEDRLSHPDKVHLFCKEVFQVACDPLTSNEFKQTLTYRQEVRDFLESLILKSNLNSSDLEMNNIFSKLSFSPVISILNSSKVQIIWKLRKESLLFSTIIFNFLDFINSTERTRLKKCNNSNCTHLFYDTSRNNTRNWCSMKSCGNIMKARKFYKKSKDKL